VKILLQTAAPILLDLASTLFFVVLFSLTHDLPLSIGTGMAIGIGQVLLAKLRRRQIGALQWMSLALVLIMGGATLVTHDLRFVMLKPTVIYAAIGASMLQRGWQLRYVPPVAAERIAPGLLVAWGYAWAGMMFAIAAGNVAIAALLPFQAWAWCVAVLYGALKLGLFALEYLTVRTHARRRYAAAALA
jgi:intracellular septation protein A